MRAMPGQIRGSGVLVVTPTPLHTPDMTTSHVAMGTWLTNLIVARKFVEVLREQNTPVMGGTRGPLVRGRE